MRVFHDLNEWISFRNHLSSEVTLGFVPTMGNLHKGHRSLFLTSAQENNHTAASVFVNPTQFNEANDFNNYPRTLEQDLQIMADSGVDFCILPTESAIYPDKYTYQLHEYQLSQLMEGGCRPGHFNGVLTIVMKLLNLVRPQRAYFGEKDYQQYLLIREMANVFFMPVDIKASPTIREPSGLAYSSRNNRLNTEEKASAAHYAAIFQQKDKTCLQIKSELERNNITVEYIEEHQNRRFIAVTIGPVRLIDNYACCAVKNF